MICQPCTDQRHDQCEDVQRQDRYLAWLATQRKRPPTSVAPTRSCPCLHRVETFEGAVA